MKREPNYLSSTNFWLRRLLFLSIIHLCLVGIAVAGQGGKGGGKPPDNTAPAEFLFPSLDGSPLDTGVITGDRIGTTDAFDPTSYRNGDNGVSAEFNQEGNPSLVLTNSPDRFLVLRFAKRVPEASEPYGTGECNLSGKSLDSLELEVDLKRLRFSFLLDDVGGVDIENRFFGLAVPSQGGNSDNSIGYSQMGVRFAHPFEDNNYEWSIVFGDNNGSGDPRRDRVKVTRLAQNRWAITGIDGANTSTAEVRIGKGKGKDPWEFTTFCDFLVDFEVWDLSTP